MDKSDIKLVAVDIDGTLLDSSGRLSERTVEAVRAVAKRGVYVVLSTGRPAQGVKKFTEKLALLDMPCILYNGAVVTIGGKVVYSLSIPGDLAREIISEGHRKNSTQVCWSNGVLYAESEGEKIDLYKTISGVEPVITDDLSVLADQGVTKLLWYDDEVLTPRYFSEMSEKLGGRIGVYPSRADFLEFVNKDCSKAEAIKIIIKKLGIRREQVAAIGDNYNDLPMLEYAGMGVAMGNAERAVKEKCGFITASCDEDGVAVFLENYLL